ncbi:hypothetical protein Nmel_007084 [Mimus melanotis]
MQFHQQQKVPTGYLEEIILEQECFLITVLWTVVINFGKIRFKAKYKYTKEKAYCFENKTSNLILAIYIVRPS